MIKVIGVRFRSAGKIYYFSPGELEIKTGDRVIVETARGVEYGKEVLGNRDVEDDKVIDRKLNVVLTRARKQLILTGNEAVLRYNGLYAQLLDDIKKRGGYVG